eukprot:Seg7039.2 transcript_id=Seg7039.2/GoldUCD/mRNA.D3Y31 product="hypothetical protein" protein_id=Seg7039.2/GoldUCD/D3Y31
MRKIEAEDLSKKNDLLEERRRKDRLRKQKSRNKVVEKLTPANQRSPRGYRRISSLSRAVNVAKNALPSSPGKRVSVLRRLATEFEDPVKQILPRQHLLSLPSQTIASVKNFYVREDISRMSAGKRDVITIRDKDGKRKLQKRHMYMSIKEAHGIFKEENPELKIGLSKFAELRPPNALLSSQTPANVCTCIYHENMILALSAINSHVAEIPPYSKDFSASCLVDPDNDFCWFGKCSHDGCGFEARYTLPSAVEGEEAKWMQWQEHGGRIAKLEMSGNVKDLYDHISLMSPKFLHHCHIKRQQAKSYQSDKELASNKDSKIAVLQMDFAENYSCSAQDEVQSAHWNQNQVTLFTTVSWLKGKVVSHVIVSDFMEHTKTAVVIFLDEILQNFPSEIEELRIWTDGPTSQFKNKFVMEGMKTLSIKHNIPLSWNFSATSHGKGPVDGIGGCLKRIAMEKVKTRQCSINNAKEFCQAVEGSQIGITFISTADIYEKEESLHIKDVFTGAKQIKGIAGYHFIQCSKEMEFVTKIYSSESSTANEESKESESESGSEDTSHSKLIEVNLGKWYAVYWEPTGYWFLGRAVRIGADDDITMEFLHQTSADANNFKTTNDVDSVSASDVILTVDAPMPVSSSRCSTVKLTEQDFANIKEAFEKFQEV